MPRRTHVLVVLALAAAAGAWFYLSSDRVWGTPFYTCLHGCTRYVALGPCQDTPPTTDYVSGDGCGLGSGIGIWIDKCETELTVYGIHEGQGSNFEYEILTGDRFQEKVLDNEACVRQVLVP